MAAALNARRFIFDSSFILIRSILFSDPSLGLRGCGCGKTLEEVEIRTW